MTEEYRNDPAVFNAAVVEEFRANEGRLGGVFATSMLLVLTATGARSGRPRSVPLGHWTVDGQLVVVASGNGMVKHPAWYVNVRADPRVHVERATPDGVESYDAHARVVEGDELTTAWAHLLEQAPFFGEHQSRIARRIPVIVLERR